MVTIKKLSVQNFCGYEDLSFDFSDGAGVRPISVFYGPNGIGKSSILTAINMAANASHYEMRDNSMLFRKFAFHVDYDPTYSSFSPTDRVMTVDATFLVGGDEKAVKLKYDPAIVDPKTDMPLKGHEFNGVEVNELPKERDGARQFDWACFLDADHPMNMQKFQIQKEAKDQFLDICEAVFGYPCSVENEVEERDSGSGKLLTYCTDFIINKSIDYGGRQVRVHFKRMSAGEKKIATMVAGLCNPFHIIDFDLFLIDNIEMHIYKDRHTRLIDKLREHFGDKQILATTHSPVLVGLEGHFDGYLPKEDCFDILEMKRGVSV